MLDWALRTPSPGGTSFIASSDANIHLLLAPGASAGPESPDGSDEGTGLWCHARWARLPEEPLVDLEPPSEVRRLRTAHVAGMVGEKLHPVVVLCMRRQLEQAWLLAAPEPGHLVSDRVALEVAGDCMAIVEELREAFPHEAWPAVPLEDGPTSFEQFLARVPRPDRAELVRDLELRTIELLRALVWSIVQKLRGRPGITTSQIAPRLVLVEGGHAQPEQGAALHDDGWRIGAPAG